VKYNDKLAPRGVHNFFPMVWRMDDLFGSGYCGDWGVHHLDIAQWGLGMDDSGPVKVIKAERSEKDKANAELGGRAQSGVVLEFAGGIQLKHNPLLGVRHCVLRKRGHGLGQPRQVLPRVSAWAITFRPFGADGTELTFLCELRVMRKRCPKEARSARGGRPAIKREFAAATPAGSAL